MQIHTREHYELMERFERDVKHLFISGYRADKEPPQFWPKGDIYQHGPTNQAFLAYRLGYAHGRAVAQQS